MTTYVVLLLGVNLGKRRLAMADLRAALTELGFENVRTVLASGNALVDSAEPVGKVEKMLEDGLTKKFDFKIQVIVWEQSRLKKLHESNPFHGEKLPANYHLYVSFFDPAPAGDLPSEPAYRLVRQQSDLAFYVQDRDQGQTTEFMSALKKAVGKDRKMTTRNWNTIGKLV